MPYKTGFKNEAVQGTALFDDNGEVIGFIPTGSNRPVNVQGGSQQGKGQQQQQQQQQGGSGTGGGNDKKEEKKLPEINRAKGYRRKLNSILKDNKASRYQGGFRSGKLSKRKLYKAEIGKENLFERRSEVGSKAYNFIVFADCSGSMQSDLHGRHNSYTDDPSKQTILINQLIALDDMLDPKNVKSEIYGFGSRAKKLKGANEGIGTVEELRGKLTSLGMDTNFLEALALAVDDVHTRPEITKENTVAVIISDGEIESGIYRGECSKYLEKRGIGINSQIIDNLIPALASKAKIVNINLGMEGNQINSVVKNSHSVYTPEEFSEVILSAVRNIARRNH